MSHEIKLLWPDDSVPDTEFNWDFVQKMVNRMVQSFHKRGPFREAGKPVDHLKSSEERVGRYKGDGNTEWLVDGANELMIEFTTPSHGSGHFRATSGEESPGLPTVDGGRIR